MTLGSMQAFGSKPDYLISYEAFQANDSHIVNYMGGVPYLVLDKGSPKRVRNIDVVSSTCPCAGLSQMSFSYGDQNKNNDWMPKVASYVLGEMKPKVYWGENAPGLAGKIGKNVRENLRKIGLENGYSMSLYRTRSLLHGVPQVRERSFYFFWQGEKTPLLNYFDEPRPTIEGLIRGVTSNFQRDPISKKTPSRDDPYYRYILEGIHGGMSHREFSAQLEPGRARGNDTFAYIEKQGITYAKVSEWMAEKGYERVARDCLRRHEKLEAGGSIMRRGTVVPKDYIGAFVAHYPVMLTHPVEDRYIDFREAMAIMGLPPDFELLNASPKNANHICQNVPVQTAASLAGEVKAVLEGKREWTDSRYLFQSNHQKRHDFWDRDASIKGIEEHFA
jgi:site-specific DNA-cytosine methylase